jgi:hypothetical protein
MTLRPFDELKVVPSEVEGRQAQGQPEPRRGLTERTTRLSLATVLFIYVFAIRTYDIATTFLMLGEQTRDWAIALGGITELPLLGAPSTAGGRGLGPAYYWLLWLGRIVLGPFMDNLPHAGGITVALLQSIADVWLFVALSRRIHWALALALCLLIASAPFDVALSSLIWNPPVAAAFIKMATAMALSLTPQSPLWHLALAAAFGWMAVQSHLSGIFVAAPLLAALAFSRRLKGVAVVGATVLLLQLPFLLALVREPSAPAGPTTAIKSLTNPQTFHPLSAYIAVTGITGNFVMPMYDGPEYTIPVLIAAIVIVIMYRKDLPLIAVTAGGVAMATLLFTTSTRPYDGYWFVTLTTALTLALGMAIAAIPSKTAVRWIGFVLLAFVIWRQPARIEDSKRFFKYPAYGTMVTGSRELIRRAPVLKDIRVTFEVHPTMDRLFVYRILGGQIDPKALYTGVIAGDGSVTVE